MKDLFGGLGIVVFYILFAVVYFPGGTILMALTCRTRELDGWDWVLSVIIPAFGMFTALLSDSCLNVI